MRFYRHQLQKCVVSAYVPFDYRSMLPLVFRLIFIMQLHPSAVGTGIAHSDGTILGHRYFAQVEEHFTVLCATPREMKYSSLFSYFFQREVARHLDKYPWAEMLEI